MKYIVYSIRHCGLGMCPLKDQPLFVQVVFDGTKEECEAYLARSAA